MLEKMSMGELARGVVLLLFGIFLFMMPGSFFTVLLFLFGVAALVDGLLAFAGLFQRTTPLGRPRWAQATEAVAGIAAGGITLLWPGLTAFFLLVIIAVWAIVTGGAELAAGMKVEKGSSLRSLEILRGVLGLAFGFLLLMRPMVGGPVLISIIGLFGIAAGVSSIGTAMALRRFGAGTRRDGIA